MKWVVTSKQSSKGREPRSVVPGLAYLGVFLVTAVYGIATGFTPAVADNLAFVAIYAVVILVGIWPALAGAPTRSAAAPDAELEAPELEAA